MKVHRLVLQAFGPYANQVEIDFAHLAEGGLFLISGRTGAGKTSLLDGICFALFGHASGEEREGKTLRSDFAPNDRPTEATLEFSLGQRLYRVRRSPTQYLKKQRGEGLTESRTSAELWQCEDPLGAASPSSSTNWRSLAAQSKAVDQRVEELLGMDEKQFRQVICLPQGRFREFLNANSADREKILERLFQTERFKKFQEHLTGRVRIIQQEREQTGRGLLARLEATGLSQVDELVPQMHQLKSGLQDAKNRESALQAAVDLAARRAQFAERSVEAHRRRELLSQQLPQLESEGQELQRLEDELQTLHEVIPKLHRLEQWQKLDRECQQLRQKSERIQSELTVLAPQQLQQQKTLQELLERESEIRIDDERIAELRVRHDQLKRQLQLEQQIQSEQGELKVKAREIEDLEIQLRQAQARLMDWQIDRETQLRGLLQKLNQRALQIDQELAAQLEEQSRLESQLFSVRLSQHLRDGEACPVCGSAAHPEPAHLRLASKIDTTSDSEVLQKRAKLDQNKDQKQDQEKEQAPQLEQDALRAEMKILEQLRVAIEIECSEIDLWWQHEAIGSHRQRPSLATSPLPKQTMTQPAPKLTQESSKLIHSLRTDFAKFRQKLEELRIRSQTSRSKHESDHQRLEKLREDLERQLKDWGTESRDLQSLVNTGKSLREKVDSHRRQLHEQQQKLSELEKYLAAKASELKNYGEWLQARAGESAELNRELDESGLPEADREAFFHLWKPKAEKAISAAALRQKRDEFLQRRARTTSELEQIETVLKELARELDHGLSGLPKQNQELQAYLLALQKQRSQLKSAQDEIASQNSRLVQIVELQRWVAEKQQALQVLEQQFARAKNLSDLVSGDRQANSLGVPLSRFVLQSRFDEVLKQANTRLRRMSRGQFQLLRPPQTHNQAQAQGLDIVVEDAATGTQRPAFTLSGGESFMAALALALGLADVVQADAGGRPLDALFIDEGFGTLDTESLDLALQTLMELQAGGRLIGVISHVGELKQLIRHQLEIVKDAQGSHAIWRSR